MKKIYLSDSPEIEKDSFKVHTKLSETLYEIIQKHEVEKESFTIGLFGEWGSGKSFIVNKLKDLVKKDQNNNISLFYIDVWKYSGFPLLRSILFDLDNQFKELSKSNNKFSCFKDGFVNSDGKGLKDILYCDEIFESQSQMNFSEYLKSLRTLLKTYKIPYFITLLLFLISIIYNSLSDEFLNHGSLVKLKEILKAFYPFFAFIGGIGIFLPILQKPLKELGELIFFRNTIKNFTEKANFSPEQFEKIFREMLYKLKNEKMVIVFDNIDRCEPSLAYETLSTIKTFMDVNNCFYIIPCDDEAIKNFLSKGNEENKSFERKFAEEFIDKIFQTYLRIPYLKEIERDLYIKEQLEQIDFENEFKQEEIEVITEILYYAYRGESPRNIKRFINDYSSYFRFANSAYPKLLQNITLFTVSVAIKQKWYNFEKILIDNPSFFKDYINNNSLIDEFEKNINKFNNNKNEFESLNIFLNNIRFYIRGFANNSIGEYLHFKEAEQSIEIVEKLRNSSDIKTEINGENFKILRKEFQRNSSSNKAFAQNSFVSWAYLIVNNNESPFKNLIILDFWKNLSESSIDYNILFFNLKDEEIVVKVIETLSNKNVSNIRAVVENSICNIFYEPLSQESMEENKIDSFQKLFELMVGSNYEFDERNIHRLFNDWKLENKYLNELLKHINTHKKKKYLPTIVLNKLNENITAETIKIYQYWNHNNIPVFYGKRLFLKLIERIKARAAAIGNDAQLKAQWANIELDYSLMYLMNTKFIEKEKAIEFITELDKLIQKTFQFSQNNNAYSNKAIDFMIEAIYSSSVAKDEYDEVLSKHFNSKITTDQRLEYLNSHIKYETEILGLPQLKSAIYKKSDSLQERILKELDDKYNNDFDLLFSLPIEIKDVRIIKEVIIDKASSKDKKDFVKYILEKIITDSTIEPNQTIQKLKELDSIVSFDGNKNILKDNKNKFIDLYKTDPSIGEELFSLLKKHLTVLDFKNLFLTPIIRFIASELESTKSVGKYENISHFIDNENIDDSLLTPITNIIKSCLANNQEVSENYLAIYLFITTIDIIDKKTKDIIYQLINENDNNQEWSQDLIEDLKRRKILNEEVTETESVSDEIIEDNNT